MIIVAIGSNLPLAGVGGPAEICEAAILAMQKRGISCICVSSWHATAPVPASDQPDFVNGVAIVETSLDSPALLAQLHEIEAEFGRFRSVPNAARTLDLDLVAYNEEVRTGPEAPILPHPRMTERGFVLAPLAEIAPGWRHPVIGRTATELLSALSA